MDIHGYPWILTNYASIHITDTHTDMGMDTHQIFIQRIGYERVSTRILPIPLTSLLTHYIHIGFKSLNKQKIKVAQTIRFFLEWNYRRIMFFITLRINKYTNYKKKKKNINTHTQFYLGKVWRFYWWNPK